MNSLHPQNPAPKKLMNFRTAFITAILVVLPLASIAYARYARTPDGSITSESQNLEGKGIQVRSIDTQIISKHWGKIDKADIAQQISAIKDLGANYVAVSTPYDNPDLLKLWADEIHRQGLNVWFRSHWLNWEGDENHPSNLTIAGYIQNTDEFIRSHPSFFKEGDAFTMCVEPEQVFVARGTEVYDWYSYNNFIVDQIDVANAAFAAIELDGKIHTNWISMNGWVVQNGLEKKTVDKMGLITIDHYPDQKETLPADVVADRLATDLNNFHSKWGKPIILGEWGYNIDHEVSDLEQQQVLTEVFKRLDNLPFLVGVNYWAHAGNNSRLINDKNGQITDLRPAATVLREFYSKSSK